MARNRIGDLRDHLFETLEALKDREHPMDVDRARAICEVGQTIINSAKVEVEMAKALELEGTVTPFFSAVEQGKPPVRESLPIPVIPPKIAAR